MPPTPVSVPDGSALDDGARQLLDFERAWRASARPKERVVREHFGFSAARYHQLLHRVVDLPEALAYDPVLVRSLLRLREQRSLRRIQARLGVPG